MEIYYTYFSKTDTLYCPTRHSISNCEGYFLASPCSMGTGYMMSANDLGKIGYSVSDWSAYGVRLVVCLPSGIKGSQDADVIWTIQE